jgi:hypothetical protein
VAGRAILPDLAAVLILMAARALARESKIGSVEVFYEDPATRYGRNIFRFVALLAGYSSMLSHQSEAGLAMVYGLSAWLPMNELKISAVVLRMAARAIVAGSIRVHPHGVHAAPLRHAFAYLRVTFKTFQLRSATTQVVALGAVCGTGKRLMRLRKLAGRDLRVSRLTAKSSKQAH